MLLTPSPSKYGKSEDIHHSHFRSGPNDFDSPYSVDLSEVSDDSSTHLLPENIADDNLTFNPTPPPWELYVNLTLEDASLRMGL